MIVNVHVTDFWTHLFPTKACLSMLVCLLFTATIALAPSISYTGIWIVMWTHVLCRPLQVLWHWAGSTDPDGCKVGPLHCQWLSWGPQTSGHARRVHQEVCTLSWVWQPRDWPGECVSIAKQYSTVINGVHFLCAQVSIQLHCVREVVEVVFVVYTCSMNNYVGFLFWKH